MRYVETYVQLSLKHAPGLAEYCGVPPLRGNCDRLQRSAASEQAEPQPTWP